LENQWRAVLKRCRYCLAESGECRRIRPKAGAYLGTRSPPLPSIPPTEVGGSLRSTLLTNSPTTLPSIPPTEVGTLPDSLLLGSRPRQGLDYSDVLHQVGRQVMALLQIGSAIVRDPNFSLHVLRDQYFERKVDGDGWRREHQGSSRSWAAEDQQFRE